MRYYMPSLTKLYQQAFQELFLPEGFKVLLRHIQERDTEYWNPILDVGRKVTMDFLASLEPKRKRKAPEV